MPVPSSSARSYRVCLKTTTRESAKPLDHVFADRRSAVAFCEDVMHVFDEHQIADGTWDVYEVPADELR